MRLGKDQEINSGINEIIKDAADMISAFKWKQFPLNALLNMLCLLNAVKGVAKLQNLANHIAWDPAPSKCNAIEKPINMGFPPLETYTFTIFQTVLHKKKHSEIHKNLRLMVN